MKNRPPEIKRLNYRLRVHPDATKHAQRIVKDYPGVEYLMKDKTLNDVYGCDDEKTLLDFAEKLTGIRKVNRG